MASKANTTEASPRGPNQPMNTTLGRSSPERTRLSATGSMRMTVRLARAYTTVAPVEILEGEGDEGGAEQEPDDEREELAAELGELGRFLEVDDLVVEQRPEGDAGDEGGDEAVGVERQRHGERGDGDRQGGQSSPAGRDPAAPGGGRDQHRAADPDGDADEDPAAQLAQRGSRLEGHALARRCRVGWPPPPA